MASYFLGIDIRVIIAYINVDIKKKVVHFGIPNSRSFLKTIKRFIEAENKARFILDRVKRLFHVYLFLKIPMQEGIFDIHLMDLPFM
jgi:hypothetical protein